LLEAAALVDLETFQGLQGPRYLPEDITHNNRSFVKLVASIRAGFEALQK